MEGFNEIFQIQRIMFIIVPILMLLMFVFVMCMLFSSKFRGKLMSHQMKAVKHMTDYSKQDMEDVMTNLGNVAVNSRNNIINENEDVLRDLANKQAEINKDAIKTTASAIRDGFSDEATMFCKHCGSVIDADSVFCKACGKEQ